MNIITSIFLGDVVALFISTSNGSPLDLFVSFQLEEHVGLQHGMALCFAHFSAMLWLESLTKMHLFHLRMSCL
jgi:hypothetical protein